MKSKLFVLVSLVLLASMVLTACGGTTADSQPSASQDDKVTIRFFHKWPEPEQLDYYNFVIAEYEKAHPNVKIEMEAASDEAYKDKIRVLMASGDVPDIYFSWAGEFSWKFARAGQAVDLTDAVMNSDWKDKIVMAAVEPFKVDGKIYGVPMRINAKFMAYNKEIFAKYNLNVPTNWDEFLSVCDTLKTNGVVPIAFGNEFPWASAHYVGDFNAKLVDAETLKADYLLTADPDKLFTDPGYVEALRRFKTLGDMGYFNNGSNGISHSNARSSFIAGKTAMFYLELEEFATIAKDLGDKWFGYFQLPGGTGGKGDQNLITGAPDGFMIYGKSKHPAEAIDFLKFVTSPEMGQEYVKRLGIPSAAVGAVTEDNSLPSVRGGLAQINEASGMALWMDTDMNIKIVEVYLPGMQALLTGSKTPEEVMKEVHDISVTVQAELKQ
jgi:raffinose/stachyose/melibiose transport system substrate-binding protein